MWGKVLPGTVHVNVNPYNTTIYKLGSSRNTKSQVAKIAINSMISTSLSIYQWASNESHTSECILSIDLLCWFTRKPSGCQVGNPGGGMEMERPRFAATSMDVEVKLNEGGGCVVVSARRKTIMTHILNCWPISPGWEGYRR